MLGSLKQRGPQHTRRACHSTRACPHQRRLNLQLVLVSFRTRHQALFLTSSPLSTLRRLTNQRRLPHLLSLRLSHDARLGRFRRPQYRLYCIWYIYFLPALLCSDQASRAESFKNAIQSTMPPLPPLVRHNYAGTRLVPYAPISKAPHNRKYDGTNPSHEAASLLPSVKTTAFPAANKICS